MLCTTTRDCGQSKSYNQEAKIIEVKCHFTNSILYRILTESLLCKLMYTCMVYVAYCIGQKFGERKVWSEFYLFAKYL